MRPIRVKASGSPITSANYQGLQEMSDTDIEQYLSYVITNKYATDWDGTLTGDLNMDTANALSGSSIGTFADTQRTESVGTHPATGATSTVNTYYFKQVTSAATESITNRPVGYDSGIKEFTDSQLDTDILDKVIEDMVSESDYTVGQFKLAASAPSGGTWTSRYTITDTHLDGSNTIYLWQKTAPTSSANSDLTSLKYDSGLKMQTAAEIEQIVPNFRNRIVEGYGSTPGVGCYLVQASSPSETGTWTQMGDAAGFSDTRHQVASSTYSGSYTGTFSGDYTGAYEGPADYSGTYTGDYVLYYSGYVGGTFSGDYTGFYTGVTDYSGTYTGFYSQDFAGNYSSDTIKAATETVSTIKLWLRTA